MKNKKQKLNLDYYENTDFGKTIRKNLHKAYIHKTKTKRITINIAENAFENAKRLDSSFGMGYQNVLKTAIFIGLQQMLEQQAQLKKHI